MWNQTFVAPCISIQVGDTAVLDADPSGTHIVQELDHYRNGITSLMHWTTRRATDRCKLGYATEVLCEGIWHLVNHITPGCRECGYHRMSAYDQLVEE